MLYCLRCICVHRHPKIKVSADNDTLCTACKNKWNIMGRKAYATGKQFPLSELTEGQRCSNKPIWIKIVTLRGSSWQQNYSTRKITRTIKHSIFSSRSSIRYRV